MLALFIYLAEIIHIGSLKLQNGREILSSKPQLLNNNENGWYYINIINSTNIDSLLKFGVSITTKSFLNPQWICAYLDSKQIEKISQIYYISEVLPSDKITDESSLLQSSKYLIYAHESFSPAKNLNYQRIYKNYYLTDKYFPQLLEDRSILHISPYSSPQLFNRFSRGAGEQEKFKVEFNDLLLIPDLPMHKHDIRGSGQVVTIIDSGLDYRSCYFKDNDFQPPVNVTNYFHRKIIRYEPFADDSDASHGHGTHVSGTVAGNADCSQCTTCNGQKSCSASLYNGHAPDSKLYFIDAGYVSRPSDLDAPYDIGYVINTSRSFGCHIFSCSWGYTPVGNDNVRLMYDEIGYENDDIIFFFGSGNSRSHYDTYAPANSKNIMAVGGVDPPEAKFVFMSPSSNIYFETTIENEIKRNICDFSISRNIFEKSTTTDPLKNFTNQTIGEKFILINNEDECPESNFQNATLYITADNSINCNAFQKVPCCHLKNADIESFFSKIENGTKASLVPDFVSEKNGPTYSIATFTTMGPSINGLVKPDILTPGRDIISAAGNTLSSSAAPCSIEMGTRSKSGTSMATPGAAGETALLAQYLQDGFYPTGKRTVNSPLRSNSIKDEYGDSITPKMTLLKALITNGAGTVRGSSYTPDCSKGFGVMHIADALVFADDSEKMERFGLRISSDMFTLTGAEKEEYVATLNVISQDQEMQKKKPLIVTLAWLDPPTGPSSEPLYADLDLFIECPDGKIVYGNQISGNHEEMYSTTERVTILDPIGGQYKIHVTCPKLAKPVEISPSVVANGPFKQLDFEANPKFLEFSKVENDRKCPFNKTGHFCQHDVVMVECDTNVSFTLHNRIPKYFCTKFTRGEIKITFSKGKGCRLQNMFISLNQVHKFGGELLYFVSPSSTSSFIISDKYVQKDSYIYITLIELVNGEVTDADIKITNETIVPTQSNSPSPTQSNSPSSTQSNSPTQSEINWPSQSESNWTSQDEINWPSPSQSFWYTEISNTEDSLPTVHITIPDSVPTKNAVKSTNFKKKFRKIALVTLALYVITSLFVYFRCIPSDQVDPLNDHTNNRDDNQALEGLLAQRNDVL